jgi:UDP-glucose 4-epimerase
VLISNPTPQYSNPKADLQNTTTINTLLYHLAVKRFLVTGGAGFIGSNIVNRLVQDGASVLVIDNESSDAHEEFFWNKDAENYKFDITDYEQTRELYENVDYVIHTAAEARIQPAIINPLLAVKSNVLGTATVLQCSREAGVKRVVYSSSSSGYGRNPTPNSENQVDDCLNPYSVSKVAGEKLCALYSSLYQLETVVFRYFNVYGKNQPLKGVYAPVIGIFLKQFSMGVPLTIVGDGTKKRDFTNVQDVVAANLLACSANLTGYEFGSVINIGTGKNFSINEIARMISLATVKIPDRIGEAKETRANIEKARKLLGWEPTVKLEDYLEIELKSVIRTATGRR